MMSWLPVLAVGSPCDALTGGKTAIAPPCDLRPTSSCATWWVNVCWARESAYVIWRDRQTRVVPSPELMSSRPKVTVRERWPPRAAARATGTCTWSAASCVSHSLQRCRPCLCRNALHLAARSCNVAMLRLLIEGDDAATNVAYVNEPDKSGITALFLAMQKGAPRTSPHVV